MNTSLQPEDNSAEQASKVDCQCIDHYVNALS